MYEWQSPLSTTYSFDPDWWNSLDDPEDAQGYLISWDDENDRILIVGATQLGLKMGVIDWFKSLEQVNFSGTGSWNPDERGGGVATCSGYSGASALDAALWDNTSKQWTAVDSLEWCPERVVNYPDIPVRMANPAHNALDGDGNLDLATGDQTTVSLLLGPLGTGVVDVVDEAQGQLVVSEHENSWSEVVFVDDIDGDGCDELLVGDASYQTEPDLYGPGAAFLYLGAVGSP